MLLRYTVDSYRSIVFGKYTPARQPSSGRIRGNNSPSLSIYSRCLTGNRTCSKKTSYMCTNSGIQRSTKTIKHGDLQTVGKGTGKVNHTQTWIRNSHNAEYDTLTSKTSLDGVTSTKAHLPLKRHISCATQTAKIIMTKSGRVYGFQGFGPKFQPSYGFSAKSAYLLGTIYGSAVSLGPLDAQTAIFKQRQSVISWSPAHLQSSCGKGWNPVTTEQHQEARI